MAGQPPPGNFNPGAYEFRPGQGQSFVPRGQQSNGQQPYDPYAQYGQQQGGYGGYQQYGQQQYPQYGGYGQQGQYGFAQGGQQAYAPPAARGGPGAGGFQPRQVQGFQPPSMGSSSADAGPALRTLDTTPAGKPVSLSIGGAGAPKAAPSLSIGGAKPGPAPSLSIGGGAPKAAPSLSIGGGAAKAAPSLSIGKKAEEKKPAPAAVPAAAADKVDKVDKAAKTDSMPPAPAPPAESKAPVADDDWDEAPATSAAAAAAANVPASTPAPSQPAPPAAPSAPAPPADDDAADSPAPTDARVKVVKGQSGASTPTNFSKASAKSDADAVLREQAAAGAEALRDLYGDDVKDTNIKSHLNIIFTGHVDAGKSTMGGQLLALTGAVDKRTLEKYEQEAKAAGRDTWYLSWALDSNKEERAKGKTVEVGRAYFETEKRRYTILDAPGHKTYVPSMISGAAQADVAMLVLSARKGEFETGFERDGQTREHAVLVKNNGINKLILLVNKMDDTTVQWDQGRYEEIQKKITPFLKALGFNPKTDLTFIPVSAQIGENMKDRISKKIAPWYDGPALLEYLDNVAIEDRDINAPFMLPISEKYNEMGTCVMGKLESGRVKKGDSLLLMPNKSTVEVAGIYTEDAEEMEMAFCGDNIRMRLRGVSDEDISPGFVLTSPQKPVKVASAFQATLSIIEAKNIIASGYSCVLHVHTLAEEVTVTALLHYYDKKTRRKSKKPPPFAKQGMIVEALIETAAPICIERFKDLKPLGRFTLRDEGRTVAIGKVSKIVDKSDDPNIAGLSLNA